MTILSCRDKTIPIRIRFDPNMQKTAHSTVSGLCLFAVSAVISVADVGQQSNDSRTLDSVGELSLVFSAGAGDSSGKNLCTLGDILSQSADILVINRFDLFCAELADLSSLAAILSAVGLCCGFSLFLDLSGLDFLCVIQCFSFLSLIK